MKRLNLNKLNSRRLFGRPSPGFFAVPVLAVSVLTSIFAPLDSAYGQSPAADPIATTTFWDSYSNFLGGFQELPHKVDTLGTPIRISGKMQGSYRVTDFKRSTQVALKNELGTDADKFRSRQEEKCAALQAEQIKRISKDPKYREFHNAGVFDSVDVEVQFSTFISPRIRYPGEAARRLNMAEHARENWQSPTYEVTATNAQSGRIVVRPIFSAFTQQSRRGDGPFMPKDEDGDKQVFVSCTVIPGEEVLDLLTRVQEAADRTRQAGARAPAPLERVPTAQPSQAPRQGNGNFVIR